MRLSANPDWWDTPPANPVLEFRCEPDADARAAAVAQGRAGVATRLRASRQKRRVEEAGRAWVDFTDPTSIILILNAAKGPCADPRVRLALSLAVDRQRAVDRVLDGDGVPLTGYVSAAHLGADLVPGTASTSSAPAACWPRRGMAPGSPFMSTPPPACPTRRRRSWPRLPSSSPASA